MPEVSIKRSSVPNNYDYMKHRLTLSFTTHFTHDMIWSSNIGIHWHSNIKWVNPACLVWKNLLWQPSGIPRNPGRLERRNSVHTADVTKILWVGKAFQHKNTALHPSGTQVHVYIRRPLASARGESGEGQTLAPSMSLPETLPHLLLTQARHADPSPLRLRLNKATPSDVL